MSIQWTFIAGYLYFEIAVVILMMLPIFSPRKWNQFFKSRLFSMFQTHAAVYFYVLLGVLCLFLFDAVREMKKYSQISEGSQSHLAAELKGHVKLFRAQRNFYITGFTIFLAFVIRRLGTMLIIQDELSIKAAKIITEAEKTVKLAKNTVLENTIHNNEVQNTEEIKKQLEENETLLQNEKKKVRDLKEELNKWKSMYEEAIAAVSSGRGDE